MSLDVRFPTTKARLGNAPIRPPGGQFLWRGRESKIDGASLKAGGSRPRIRAGLSTESENGKPQDLCAARARQVQGVSWPQSMVYALSRRAKARQEKRIVAVGDLAVIGFEYCAR